MIGADWHLTPPADAHTGPQTPCGTSPHGNAGNPNPQYSPNRQSHDLFVSKFVACPRGNLQKQG